MARGRRRLAEGASIWPGFVDVLSGLLMIIIFLVLVLSVAQFFLSSDFDLISDRAQALERDNATLNAENQGLQGQVDQLSGQIELLFEQVGERTAERDAALSELRETQTERATLLGQLSEAETLRDQLRAALSSANDENLSLSSYIARLESENSALQNNSTTLNVESLGYLAELDESARTQAEQAAKLAALQQRFAYLFPDDDGEAPDATGTQDLVLQVEATAELLDRMLARASSLQTELEQLIAARDYLSAQLDSADATNAQLAEDLVVAQSETSELTALLAARERDLARVDQELIDAYAAIEADEARITALVGEIELLRQVRDRALAQVNSLQAALSEREGSSESLQAALADAEAEAEVQSIAARDAQAQIGILNIQVNELRQQLARLEVALDASEERARDQGVEISTLSSRLNAALAERVEELAAYRSEFFGRLSEVLGQRTDVDIVGDRFILQSEVLFASGSAEISSDGQLQLDDLAQTILSIAADIPDSIDWVLRVDGHTDPRPVISVDFENNWQLSTERARTVGEYLIARGVPPSRIAITGFGEFRPLVTGNSEAAYAQNRRIEFKLTQR